MMASSSSSSNLSDPADLLQDDLPWPPMPFSSTLHTIGASNHQYWRQPLMLNCSDHLITSDDLEALLSAQSNQLLLQSDQAAVPSSTTSDLTQPQLSSVLMMQELGLQWSSTNCTATDADDSMIKEEELPESLNNSTCGGTNNDAYSDIAIDGAVLPSINVSRLQKHASCIPVPAAGDALEMIASARLSKTLLLSRAQHAATASVIGHSGIRSDHAPWPYGPPAHAAHLVQGRPSIMSRDDDSDDHYKLQSAAALVNGTNTAAGGAGRGGRNGSGEHRSAASLCQQVAAVSPPPPPSKKPRLESRSSSAITPLFKVRKEKLGDRIAALQQLVSPFGKTDTASVLMEAIGYIKFLQDQVETLSGPYMRSDKNKKARTTQQRGASNAGDKEGAKIDLRSRGLCLVPLSCTSYVTNENGVWVPPNFRGN